MRNNGSVTASPRNSRDVVGPPQTANLADLLERVLDKGIVIAGDITLFLGGVQLLTLRIRLLVASIDKAQELGINWWQSDPALPSRASAHAKELEQERDLLQKRLDRLERLLPPPQEADQERAAAGQRSTAAAASVHEMNGKLSAELTQPVQPAEQPQDEQPQALERASQPQAAQPEQSAGAAPLLDPALHERIAQAMRPVLEGLPQWIAQAWQPAEQARPEGERGATAEGRTCCHGSDPGDLSAEAIEAPG